jgi:hypothetical protein
MELITAILISPLLGYLAPTPRAALVRYLLVWAVVFAVQTPLVHFSGTGSGTDWTYWPVNAAILAGGITLNQLAFRYGRRRRSTRASTA